MFRRSSIKLKLTLITAISCTLALFVAAAGYLYYDLTSFKSKLTSDLTTEAEVIGSNCGAGIAFNDPAAVSDVLKSLRAQSNIRSAAVYTADGKLFASYAKKGEASPQETLGSGIDRSAFVGDTLSVYRRIRSDSDVVGTLYIASNMKDWYARRNRFSVILGCLMLACAGVAVLVSSRLQRMISQPILDLAQTMRSVAVAERYDTRAVKKADDEIGELVDGFNSMLAEIEERDRDLHAANDELELHVNQRTVELVKEIAERRSAQDELIKSQAMMMDFFENASVGLHFLSPDGTILRANRSELHTLGYDAAEYVGKLASDFHEDKSVVPELLDRLLANEPIAQCEAVMRCKNGQTKDIAIEANALWKGGEFIHARCFTRDLTAQKEAERAQDARRTAERANLAKNEFLSRMSHELRTPMNSILGFSQLLEMDDLSDDQRDSVKQIVSAGGHLLKLINEVLDISRIETGNLAISKEPVDISEVTREVVSLVHPLADQRSVSICTADAGAHTFVLADRQRLCQVLLNLVSNAIKYNVDFGKVAVSTEVRGDLVRINVKDTGGGIAPENAERLFMPFERLGAEQTTIEGTGLGLALSKRLCEAMGATIGLEPSPQGAHFFIELPLSECPVGSIDSEAWEQPAATGGASGPSTILLVEDNAANVRLVEKIFANRPNYRIIVAMQGSIAIDLAREHRPDLILLDLNLPDMEGLDVLKTLRDLPETNTIPIAVVSADATPSQITRLLASGAFEYLTKPLNVAAFLKVVEQACSIPVKRSA